MQNKNQGGGRIADIARGFGVGRDGKRLTALLIKAVKAGAASQFYARAGALQAIDLASLWSEDIEAAENTEGRKEAAGRLEADGQSFAEWWLKKG